MVDTDSPEKTSDPGLTPGEVQKFITALPVDSSRAADAVLSRLNAIPDKIDPGVRFAAISQIDDAAQPHIRQLFQEYLQTPSHNKTDETRLWMLARGYWANIAYQYILCVKAAMTGQEKSAQQLRSQLPRIIARALLASGENLKWEYFRYQPVPQKFWQETGRAYLLAEKYGFADKQQQIYPGPGGISSPHTEYLKALFFQSASLNSLQPSEIEIADRLITHLLPNFSFSTQKGESSLYWIDLGAAQEPSRINSPPPVSPNLRYFGPGDAITRLQMLEQEATNSDQVPAKIARSDKFEPQEFLRVARHLALQWSATPPQRSHERHRVNHRIYVLPGFVNSFVMASPEFGGKPLGLPLEQWAVENVSQGGFGAIVKRSKKVDWVRVGALIALQPNGTNNWVIGLIRRVQHVSEEEIRVGIETLSRNVVSLEAHPRAEAGAPQPPAIPAVWFRDDDHKAPVRFVFPSGELNMNDILDFNYKDRHVVLRPVQVLERGSDYDLVTCKATAVKE